MKKTSALLVGTMLSVACSFGVRAQEGPPTFSPIELLGCNFVNGADMDDLDVVIDTWNEWMDDNAVGGYTAFLLSPMYTASSFEFDLIWLGAFENGAALGGFQPWLANGGDVQDDFAEVIDCPLRQAMAIANVQELGEPTGIVPVEFSNCTLREGRIPVEAAGAMRQLIDFYVENGSDAGHWILLPGPGEEPDADYNFKWATAYTSYEALGRDFETLMNGGGLQRANQTVGRVMSCDHPRMYNSRLIRGEED